MLKVNCAGLMARPREFDLDEVLDAAMQTFWHRGYEATSLADLMVATGLKKGSLYKAFKDKRSLFLQALGRYFDQAYRFHQSAIAEAASPKEGLRNWLQHVLEVYGGYSDCRGCFGVNTLVELAPHDEVVKQRLHAAHDRLEQLLVETIARGQALGELRQDVSAEDLAALLLQQLTGMFAMLKAAVPPAVMQHQVNVLITLLE